MNNLHKVQKEMQEESLWSLCPVNDIDTILPNRYGPYRAFSSLYYDLYLREFKESLKHTMLDQESVFEDQIHELHRLYRRQKDLMMQMEEANNLYSQPQHLLLNSGISSPRRSIHWMGSCVSTSKTSVFPPEEAFSNIDEAGISRYEIDKSRQKVLDLELPSCGYLDIGEEGEEEGSKNGEVLNFPKDQPPRIMSLESVVQPENVQHLTGLARSKCIVDLTEPAKIWEHSDYELNPLLSPAQRRSERAEPEVQEPQISTKSQAESPRKSSIKASDCITPLHWFAKIASSVVEDSKNEVGLSVTGFHSNYQIDNFEAMTLHLTEMEPEEQRTNTPVSNIVHPKHKRTLRGKGKRQQLDKDGHNEFLPSLSTFARNEASEDLQKIGRLIKASETNDAHSSYNSLRENMRFDWGSIRKRRRGIISPAGNTKTRRAFLQVPFSGS